MVWLQKPCFSHREAGFFIFNRHEPEDVAETLIQKECENTANTKQIFHYVRIRDALLFRGGAKDSRHYFSIPRIFFC